MDIVMSSGFKSFVNYFTTKKKEKLDYILEPFQAMVQLALLGYSPVGSKLTIQDNILCIQQPGLSQGVIRYFNDDNKDDLYYLFNVFRRFINYYSWMISHPEYYKLYLLLLKMSIQGLDNLIQTYSDTDKISVLHTLQMYKTILIKNYKLSLQTVGKNKKIIKSGELSKVYKRQRTISNQSTNSNHSTNSNNSTQLNQSNNINNINNINNESNQTNVNNNNQTINVNKVKSNDSFTNLLKRIDSNSSLIGKYSNTFKDNNTMLNDIENELLEATIVDNTKKNIINDDGEVSSLDSDEYNDYLELKLPISDNNNSTNNNSTNDNIINKKLESFDNDLNDIMNLNNQEININNNNKININNNNNNNKININNKEFDINNHNRNYNDNQNQNNYYDNELNINSETINLDFNDFNKGEDNIDKIFKTIINIYNEEEYIIIYNTLILLDKFKSNYNNYILGLEYTLKNTNMKIKKWINDNVGL